jgi:NAD(P)-dependent dehydrogenase (short-subunit alcohol dehydrogenase family)
MSNYQVDLTGKVVLVTGGSRGLGRAMSIGLAEAGASVVIVSRNLESCEDLASSIRKSGGKALALAADYVDIPSLDALLEEAYQQLSQIDVLINNAGINCGFVGLDTVTVEQMDEMYQVNLRGPWYLASRAAPRMGQHGGGSIINVISVGGLKPPPFLGPYAATKSGLHALTKVMAQEWGPLNIRVNSLAPGSYHSDLFDNTEKEVPGFEQLALEASTMKRVADTEEILGPVMYLASDASSFTTGACLVADGGHLTL